MLTAILVLLIGAAGHAVAVPTVNITLPTPGTVWNASSSANEIAWQTNDTSITVRGQLVAPNETSYVLTPGYQGNFTSVYVSQSSNAPVGTNYTFQLVSANDDTVVYGSVSDISVVGEAKSTSGGSPARSVAGAIACAAVLCMAVSVV